MDKIAVFGVPRSGTTWISQIFNSHPEVTLRFQPLFSYGHKNRLSDRSSCGEIHAFFEEIYHTQDSFVLMTSDSQRNYPVFSKSGKPTHLVFKETRYLHIIENILTKCDDVKIVGIVRNPLATLASWIMAPREYDREWDIHREWRKAVNKNQHKPEEFYGFEKWKQAAVNFLHFQEKYPERFYLVRYNELNDQPVEETMKMFRFCGLNLCSQVKDFLKGSCSLHESDPYSVYRANANDDGWLDVLPPDIVEEIHRELINSPLSCYLCTS